MKRHFQFTKMHGLGNDFIVIDGINQRVDDLNLSTLGQQLCDRRIGIGADGLVVVGRSASSDLRMRIINADGSEPEICGNGLRCFAKFAYDNNMIDADVVTVQTEAGIVVPALLLKDGEVDAVEVDMGQPRLDRGEIPIKGPQAQRVINEAITVDDKTFEMTGVSMGNPHAVVFSEDLKQIDLERVGPLFETHEMFPEKCNVEFVQVMSNTEVVAVVWERGAGETLACGSGACAIVVAGVLTGRLARKVTVHLPGGPLLIEWQDKDNHVMMTGPAETVYRGEIEV